MRWSPNSTVLRPSLVDDGLAVYAIGSGEPVLLIPYPDAATVAGGCTLTALVEGLKALGRRVLTFDPPARCWRGKRSGHGERARIASS